MRWTKSMKDCKLKLIRGHDPKLTKTAHPHVFDRVIDGLKAQEVLLRIRADQIARVLRRI